MGSMLQFKTVFTNIHVTHYGLDSDSIERPTVAMVTFPFIDVKWLFCVQPDQFWDRVFWSKTKSIIHLDCLHQTVQ